MDDNTSFRCKDFVLDAKILMYGLRGGFQGLEREGKFEHIRQQER